MLITIIATALGAALWYRIIRPRDTPPVQDVLDRMAAGHIADTLGHENLAWPPGSLFVANGEKTCGCVIATSPDGTHIITCPAHDPEFVTEWEQRYAE